MYQYTALRIPGGLSASERVLPAETLQRAFKTLSDPTRVRILALLDREELAVQELTSTLEMAQSRVSGHLRILRDTGWVADRSEGTFHFYRFVAPARRELRRCWELVRTSLRSDEVATQDAERLTQVVRERATRTRAFFDAVAPEWDVLRGMFNDDALRANAIARLIEPGLKVVEVGAGTGALAFDLARLGIEVLAVDHSPRMLQSLREGATRSGAPGLRTAEGDAEDLPLGDGEVDAALAHMVLRYLPRPAAAVAEMARVTRPRGWVVLIDFVRHEHEWMRKELGVQWLGFTEEELEEWFLASGLDSPQIAIYGTESKGRELPATFVASARKASPPEDWDTEGTAR